MYASAKNANSKKSMTLRLIALILFGNCGAGSAAASRSGYGLLIPAAALLCGMQQIPVLRSGRN